MKSAWIVLSLSAMGVLVSVTATAGLTHDRAAAWQNLADAQAAAIDGGGWNSKECVGGTTCSNAGSGSGCHHGTVCPPTAACPQGFCIFACQKEWAGLIYWCQTDFFSDCTLLPLTMNCGAQTDGYCPTTQVGWTEICAKCIRGLCYSAGTSGLQCPTGWRACQ